MEKQEPKCIVCEMADNEVPLIAVLYQGQQYHICPQHFPILIHKPQNLADKLPGLEKLEGHEH